jgi:hypothetical protein
MKPGVWLEAGDSSHEPAPANTVRAIPSGKALHSVPVVVLLFNEEPFAMPDIVRLVAPLSEHDTITTNNVRLTRVVLALITRTKYHTRQLLLLVALTP